VTLVTTPQISAPAQLRPLSDSSTQIVEAIWPTSSVVCRNETGNNSVLPLRTFIQETLRRSRTSYSTLQVALYYLILIKAHVPEHDFTMEQPVDCHASRALQCGRRMFLAALILASKYLQDRNYSARAWSRISGLATQEINQNEMAFLAAVNWKLHITEEVYHRWTDCVMKFKPPQPPSPGSPCQGQFDRQCEEFRAIVLKLSPELENVDDLAPCSPTGSRSRDFPVVSPKWLTAASERSPGFGGFDTVSYGTPSVMEPTPTPAHTPGRLAPALGLLPTPRLTPQTGGFSTPAVSAVPFLLGRASSMGYAMAQASGVSAAQGLDRWPGSSSSSPLAFGLTRRSSLATSVSAASSPDSMVSDSSRISRSSSISSASSLASAPYAKLDVLARCRSAKQCGERFNLRPAIASVPEDYTPCLTSSPEAYSGPVGKDLCDLSLETPLGRREREMDEAARALQELQNHCAVPAPATQRPSLKRSRTFSTDHSLQDNVREMLGGRLPSQATWPDALVRPRPGLQVPVASTLGGGRKRVCCSNEAMDSYGNAALLHPSMNGLAGPGMWEGIL